MVWDQTASDNTLINLRDGAQTYANGKITSAAPFLNALSSLLNMTVTTIADVRDTVAAYAATNQTAAVKTDLALEKPTVPTLSFTTAPDRSALPTPPADPDDYNRPAAVEKPTKPLTPELVERQLLELGAALPTMQMPLDDAVYPNDDLLAPTNVFEFDEVAYSSTLRDKMNAKLLDWLDNGGYGLEPGDEQALMDRERDRQEEIGNAAIEETKQLYAGSGFTIPPRSLLRALDAQRQKKRTDLAASSREIVLKRAELYAGERRFTMEQVMAVETLERGFHTALMERSLNVSKLTLETGVQIYYALADRVKTRLAQYQAKGEEWERRVGAAMTEAETYRVKKDAERISDDRQRVENETYKAKMRGISELVDQYRTEAEAANAYAQTEEVRFAVFSRLIDSYAAQVKAKAREFDMYLTETRGELGKLEATKVETDVFNAHTRGVLGAYGIGIDADRINAASHDASNRINLDYVGLQLENIGTMLNARVKAGGTGAEVYAGLAKAVMQLQANLSNVASQLMQLA